MIILNRECSAPYVLLLAITGRRKIILLRIKDTEFHRWCSEISTTVVFKGQKSGRERKGGGGLWLGRGGNKAGEKIEQNKYVVFIIIYQGFVWSRYFAH